MTVRGVLSDVHGVLYVHPEVIPGSADAVARLRASGLPFRFLTNSTQFPKRHILATLAGCGIELDAQELLTSPEAAGETLVADGHRRVGWLANPDLAEDLPGIEPVFPGDAGASAVDAVLVGDLGDDFTYATLNRAFRWIHDGASLVALARNRYYAAADGLVLDSGPFVRLLEEATGVEATVTGKPAPAFFRAGLAALGTDPTETVMIGDDLEFDVLPAMDLGLTGILVRTGKYREEVFARAPRRPDRVAADLAGALDPLLP